MRKVFISAGHSNSNRTVNGKGRDRGAAGNGYIEGEQAAEFRDILVEELNKLGLTPVVDKKDSILSESIAFFKNLVSANAIVLDIHFNSASPKATGTETLIPSSHTSFERSLAENLSKTVSEILNIPMRGSKGVKTEAESHHGRLGWMRLTGENVLMEICFISNPNDIKSFRNKRYELGKSIAKVIYDAATDKEKVYVVVKGDSLSKIAAKYKTTVQKIKQDNKLNSDIIQIGQQLKINL